MTYLNRKTLLRIRDRLKTCLVLMHEEANASSIEEVRQAIALLDIALDSEDERTRTDRVIQLIGKVVEKLPWIASVLKDLD